MTHITEMLALLTLPCVYCYLLFTGLKRRSLAAARNSTHPRDPLLCHLVGSTDNTPDALGFKPCCCHLIHRHDGAAGAKQPPYQFLGEEGTLCC